MNQQKIGAFIAQQRKQHELTQKQLAEKLCISDKAVSKWETGRSMPDNTLLLDLCEILGINVNELLSGEKLSDYSYHGKAEENMMNLISKSENEKKLRKRTWLAMSVGAVAVAVLLLGTIVISAGDLIWYLDTVSLLVVVSITFLVLLSAGMVRDFARAFLIVFGRKTYSEGSADASDNAKGTCFDSADDFAVQTARSLKACRLVLAASPVSGAVVTIIGVVSVFVQGIPAGLIGANIAVALLTLLYGLIIDLFIAPVAARLAAVC